MAREVVITADKIKKKRKTATFLKLSILAVLLLLIITYVVLSFALSQGTFSVSLKYNKDLQSGLQMYESLNDRTEKWKLSADDVHFMTNTTLKWLPENIDDEGEGSHNGDNYIAFTFYLENTKENVINYWYQVVVDDVIKNVDEAIRIMIFRNGESEIYAKKNGVTNEPEADTLAFRDDSDGTVILKHRTGMIPGDIDKLTVVIWIEGNDPDCVNALIGGEIQMHMDVTEEHIEQY